MSKWALRALEPGNSPLQVLLRHRLTGFQPPGPGRWPRSLQWMLLPRFHAPRGPPLWHRFTQSWRIMSPHVDAVPPTSFEEVQNTSLWWTTTYVGHNFGFSEIRARQLAAHGLQCLRDLWEPESMTILPWEVLERRFHLREQDRPGLLLYQTHLPQSWRVLFTHARHSLTAGEWMGIFPHGPTEDPCILLQATDDFRPLLTEQETITAVPVGCPQYLLGLNSRNLILLTDETNIPVSYRGSVHRVRVISVPVSSRPRSPLRHRYLAPLSRLTFDPGRWRWRDGKPLFAYSAKHGTQLHRPRTGLSLPIHEKWAGLISDRFSPNWHAVWTAARPRKEAAFLWSLYHRAIAVNHWRQRAFPLLSEACTCCSTGESETLIHCFFSCSAATRAWQIAWRALSSAVGIPPGRQHRPGPTWDQCLLGTPLPGPFQQVENTWSLIRGAILWVIWIRRNACVFQNDPWPDAKLDRTVWDAVLDLGRSAWARIRWLERVQPLAAPKATREFLALWVHRNVFCEVLQDQVRWNYSGAAFLLHPP
ncbi:hypothetical protein KC19_5G029800 [Ceratodon purpureus]|uniref:Reverse transcriptase zinc-binding domain-containing protein n=1 Tax=Ceratodon purpureus TaxID=3225 RepID=A0A8T0HYK1_CERPU|nr:hypothetical protein KC19_5G029800 [Ceratodon purpureus]